MKRFQKISNPAKKTLARLRSFSLKRIPDRHLFAETVTRMNAFYPSSYSLSDGIEDILNQLHRLDVILKIGAGCVSAFNSSLEMLHLTDKSAHV